MRTIWLALLVVLALAVGTGVGLMAGFFGTIYTHVQTDLEVACAVLHTAESAGYLSKERRTKLVDTIWPTPDALKKNGDKAGEQAKPKSSFDADIRESVRKQLNCTGF